MKANRDQIELSYLPPYSPELNSDELAWAHVNGKVSKALAALAKTCHEMRAAIFRALAQLQKRPDIVAAFFHASTADTCKREGWLTALLVSLQSRQTNVTLIVNFSNGITSLWQSAKSLRQPSLPSQLRSVSG